MKLHRRALEVLVMANLALGLGAAIAIFSVANALFFRPLPYPAPQELVAPEHAVYPKGYYEALEQRLRALQLAAYAPGAAMNLEQHGRPVSLHGAVVSPNFFTVLGVAPALGTGLEAGEEQPGRNAVVVISHKLWQQRFGARRDVVGQQISLGGIERRIAAVMPARFRFPSVATQFWVPLRVDPGNTQDYWETYAFQAVGRLRAGTTLAAARADFSRAAVPAVAEFPYPVPASYASTYPLVSLRQSLSGSMAATLLLLLGATGLLLLIACANAAILLLTQFCGERRDTAVRLALGCGQARLLRRFLARSVRLALIGGGGGLLIAFWALPVLARLLPSAAAGAAAIPLDWRALVFAAGVSLAAGLVTGLIPAWRGSRANLARDVRDGVAAPEPAGRLPLPSLLLIGEIALALVVVIAGALVAQSLRNLTRQDPGFRATGVTTVRVHPAAAYCAAAARCAEFYRQLRARAAALPGVRSAAVVNSVPLGGIPEIAAVVFQDHPLLPGKPVALIWADIVTPGYRATAGIPLLQGRDFSASDGPQSQPVALISASLAGSLWPGQTALGKTVTTLTTGMRAWTIVGVVEGVREFQLQGDPGFYRGEVYFPLAQAMATPPLAGSMATMTLVLRSPAPPTAATLRRMIVDLNPEAAADQPRTLRAIVYASVAGPRTTAWLFGWFALLALAMAMFGVYAVMGEAVGQRHREMGVRLALGARPAAIFRLVLFRGLVCAAAGIGLGAAAAWLLCRLLRNLLFEVSPADPVLFAGAALLVLAAAMLACCGPARRASRVDPAAALRGE